MGQVLHRSATTTEAIGPALQHRQESLRALSKRYGINQKTMAKWKQRTAAADLPICRFADLPICRSADLPICRSAEQAEAAVFHRTVRCG